MSQQREPLEVLETLGPPGGLLDQREVEGEYQRLHQVLNRFLHSTKIQNGWWDRVRRGKFFRTSGAVGVQGLTFSPTLRLSQRSEDRDRDPVNRF